MFVGKCEEKRDTGIETDIVRSRQTDGDTVIQTDTHGDLLTYRGWNGAALIKNENTGAFRVLNSS